MEDYQEKKNDLIIKIFDEIEKAIINGDSAKAISLSKVYKNLDPSSLSLPHQPQKTTPLP